MITAGIEKNNSSAALIEPGEYEQFMLRTPAEIMPVLRGLFEQVSQITVFFNEGQHMLLTTLAEVTADHLILDFGPNGDSNRLALVADKHFCVTTLDKVRVQFILREFVRVEHQGRPAFRSGLPAELLRLQRREYYRLITPVVRPLKCAIPIPLPDGSFFLHEANIFDISGGGIGLSAPPEAVPFGEEMALQNCRVELPEIGIITGTLIVRSLYAITLRTNARVRRAGCEFANLPGPMATLIQRYIIKIERERKARESGMN